MNRLELADFLDTQGVSRDAFRLDGSSGNGALSLGRADDGGWAAWYSDGAERRSTVEFATEDDACTYVADRLLADEGNRWVLVAGPAGLAEADRDLGLWLDRLGVSRAELAAGELRSEVVSAAGEVRCRHWVLRTTSRRLPETLLSAVMARRVMSFPASDGAVHRVGVSLVDGREFADVVVVDARVCWVVGCDTVPFVAADVVDVWPRRASAAAGFATLNP